MIHKYCSPEILESDFFLMILPVACSPLIKVFKNSSKSRGHQYWKDQNKYRI